jgi:hypothetical protein
LDLLNKYLTGDMDMPWYDRQASVFARRFVDTGECSVGMLDLILYIANGRNKDLRTRIGPVACGVLDSSGVARWSVELTGMQMPLDAKHWKILMSQPGPGREMAAFGAAVDRRRDNFFTSFTEVAEDCGAAVRDEQGILSLIDEKQAAFRTF